MQCIDGGVAGARDLSVLAAATNYNTRRAISDQRGSLVRTLQRCTAQHEANNRRRGGVGWNYWALKTPYSSPGLLVGVSAQAVKVVKRGDATLANRLFTVLCSISLVAGLQL